MTTADSKNAEEPNLKNNDVNETLDFDKILQEEVGQFGWFQIRNIILALISVVFLAWANNSYVFTTARIPSRCLIPECDLEKPEFAPGWLSHAVPSSASSFESCQRFGNASAATNVAEEDDADVCPATWFDRQQVKSCESHVYKNTDTVVYDFNLACDEWRRTIIGSTRIFGTMIAHCLTGLLSDRWGRRTALVFNGFNSAWIGTLKSFTNSYTTFLLVEFLQATMSSGAFQAAHILMVELVRPEHRVLTSTIMNTCVSIALMMMGLTAWAIPNWRDLTLALHIPQFITILYIWLMGESVRWYISNHRYEHTKKALISIARANNKQVSDKTLEILRKKAEISETKTETLQEEKQGPKDPSLFKLLFKYKSILLRTLITPFLWISFTLIFQGLTINAVNISENKYLNYIAVSSAQIPGFWISFVVLDKIGRKPVLLASFWLCAACQIGFIFIPKSLYFLSLLVYMVGASCSGAIMSSLYIYTAELYPTAYRHRLFAFSSTVGRAGAMLAPLTPALGALVWENFPFALFAGCACVSGALVLLTPETRGARLPDTMQEAADLGRKGRHSTKI